MPLPPQTQTLLLRAARRRQWVEFGRHFRVATFCLAAGFFGLLLLARLTAAIPDITTPARFGLVPLLGAAIAWFTHRRVAESEAAGIIDCCQGNHDLFLTTAHLEASAGTYQDRIRQRAERSAQRSPDLATMIPWNWEKPLGSLIALATIGLIAILWLPQFDPFGKDEEREWLGKQAERLEELGKETEARLNALDPGEAVQRAEAIEQALTKLEETFRLAREEERREVARKLHQSQDELGQFWKQLNDEKLREALQETSEQMQRIGQTDSALTPEAKRLRDQLREMLRAGDTRDLEKAIAEMIEKSEALKGAAKGSEAQRQGTKDLQSALQELADAVAGEAPSDPLQETLQRALEQMQIAQNAQLTDEALEGTQQSLQELQRQLEALGDQLQQLEKLDDALKAAQLAQLLNEMRKMPGDGGSQGQGKSMKDYADLYEELLAEAGGRGNRPGTGAGMKGEGTGQGGVAPEDESLQTAFKDEKSPSHLVAGKTLLEWKTNAVSETGEASRAFRDSITQLKQGLSEAIRQERVPAGYHSQIQTYFDTIEVESPSSDDLD